MIATDLYAALELEPSATTEDVRKAYFRLAKVYHPDRQAAADPEATERFLLIQQAYEVLSDPMRREDYDAQRVVSAHESASDPPKDPSPKASRDEPPRGTRPTFEQERDARMAYLMADELLERGEVDKAVRAMRAVVRVVPDRPEYMSMLGYLLGLKGQRLHHARDLCRRAVQAEPHNADFHAHLGYVYKQAGLGVRAEQCFEDALRLNPRHPLAVAHLNGRDRKRPTGILARLKQLLVNA